MGAGLYSSHSVYARALDECDRLFTPLVGRPVTLLDEDDLAQTRWTQPALFALEYALAQLWLSWGIRPNSVAGHSIGEVVAATVATAAASAHGYPDLAGAAVTLAGQCAISGGRGSLAELVAILPEPRPPPRQLAVSHALHSPNINAVLDEFRDAINGLTFH